MTNNNPHECFHFLEFIPDNLAGRLYTNMILRIKATRTWTTRRVGYHLHHILPKHYGEDNSPNNLVPLTPTEHAIAHVYLAKSTNNYKDWWAVCRTLRDKHNIKESILLNKYKKNPVITSETREKMSKARKEFFDNNGKVHNAGTAGTKTVKAVNAAKKAWETRRKNGKAVMSQEQKEKIRQSVIKTKNSLKHDIV